MALTLKNPHSVLAAIETRPADVLEVRANLKTASDGWRSVADAAHAHRIPVRPPMPTRDVRGKDGGRVGGSEAVVRERESAPLEALFGTEAPSGLWLALDRLQDPHNVGAIFRTASFFGVKGIVLTRDQSAPMTSAVYDVASGGTEYVPFAILPNLVRAIEISKEAGMWVLGTSEHAEKDVKEIDRDRKWLMVVGNEEQGMRRLTGEHCDEVCRLTPRGGVTSLNVSAATAVLIAALA
jgi:23S rRNA (guanosine2251-2'-O)-methyltransferase